MSHGNEHFPLLRITALKQSLEEIIKETHTYLKVIMAIKSFEEVKGDIKSKKINRHLSSRAQ